MQGPASNHAVARSLIDSLSADGGTDTGDALQLALQLLQGGNAKHPPAAIVLLSDGAANAGPDPVAVAQAAKKDHIPIYTVALGTAGGVLQSPDPFQPNVPVPPDPQLMQAIARVSGGRAFNARSADELSSIYKNLGSQLSTVTPQARDHGVVRRRGRGAAHRARGWRRRAGPAGCRRRRAAAAPRHPSARCRARDSLLTTRS